MQANDHQKCKFRIQGKLLSLLILETKFHYSCQSNFYLLLQIADNFVHMYRISKISEKEKLKRLICNEQDSSQKIFSSVQSFAIYTFLLLQISHFLLVLMILECHFYPPTPNLFQITFYQYYFKEFEFCKFMFF